MLRDGYNPLGGTFVVTEVPFAEAEVKQLKEEGLVPNNWTPPPALASYVEQGRKEGDFSIRCSDPRYP